MCERMGWRWGKDVDGGHLTAPFQIFSLEVWVTFLQENQFYPVQFKKVLIHMGRHTCVVPSLLKIDASQL